MKIAKILITLAAFGLASFANADPIRQDVEYTLLDHPSGSARPPTYGLRLDGLTDGDSSNVHTYEFMHPETDGMYMYWDSYYNSLTIYGSVYGGSNADDGYASASTYYIYSVYYDMYSCYDGGLCSNYGEGYIYNDSEGYYLTSVSGSHSYDFQLNTGHRGHPGVSGWGWLNHCPIYGSDSTASCDQHIYSSDWIFTVVPEPGVLSLLGIGLIGMGLARRRRRA